MSTDFVVTCAARSFNEWLENLDQAAEENKDMTSEQRLSVEAVRAGIARFNAAFRDRIAP